MGLLRSSVGGRSLRSVIDQEKGYGDLVPMKCRGSYRIYNRSECQNYRLRRLLNVDFQKLKSAFNCDTDTDIALYALLYKVGPHFWFAFIKSILVNIQDIHRRKFHC